MTKKKAIIVGCGLAGIVSAIVLKGKGYEVEIFESRNHIGGNCYDSNVNGVMMHNYGPHIFHTNNDEVFSFLSRYTEWLPFELRPKGNTELGLISLPYSLTTTKELSRELSDEEIIEFIFKDYSEKQWGVPFEEIPKTIIKRIPGTKGCDDPTWFEGQKYQCIPKYGYTKMMESMLNGIKVSTGVDINEWRNHKPDIIVYTGKIDEYFNYEYGDLGYRTLDFVHYTKKSRRDHFIINENNNINPWTRSYDHAYFTLNHKGQTIVTYEFPRNCLKNDIPFYPIIFGPSKNNYLKYKDLADQESGTVFIGRLATYKYLDMWEAVGQVFNKLKNI